jgi:hypothetical protein
MAGRRRQLSVYAHWGRLAAGLRDAMARFDAVSGALTGLPPAERAARRQAVDEAVEACRSAEGALRAFRQQQFGLGPLDRGRHVELLDRWRQMPSTPPPPAFAADPLTGLRCGDSATVEVRLLHAAPQQLAALAGLVRSLPPGAVQVRRMPSGGPPYQGTGPEPAGEGGAARVGGPAASQLPRA